jgi:hypothetical protein
VHRVRPSYHEAIATFLIREVGASARPLLEETARSHPNQRVRERARKALARY